MTENAHTPTEVAIGVFVMAGLAGLAYLSVSIGGIRLFSDGDLKIHAKFASVGDLKEGAAIKIAGVRVGQVDKIVLQDYAAETLLSIDKGLEIPADTIASIRTEGLLGESYVMLRPGGSDKNIEAEGRIVQTEPAIDLIDLAVKYALNKGSSDDPETPASDPLGE